MTARVAVLIPCFNDGDLLLETIASLDEDEPLEIVVIDDHSTDERTKRCLEQLEDEDVRVLRHERNMGPAASRMTGLHATSAPYVFPLDSDDLAVPGALGRMADLLDAAPDAAVCFGDYAEFGDTDLVRAVPERIDAFRIAYTNEYPVTALYRRTALVDAGGWDSAPTLDGYEDWSLWATLAERNSVGLHAGIGVLTYRRRLHGDRQLTLDKKRHGEIYRQLRAKHPRLFADLPTYRRQSDLSRIRKLLYPLVYGARPRSWLDPRLKRLLDNLGLWTLKR
jgi:glycosyltransferase involved in cell wall biosynthesis